jgi:nitroimidazol reductase NimA-like FMN-containing flavoprotein (pyridoxamine 5'-phosphate oxidase superfamily)
MVKPTEHLDVRYSDPAAVAVRWTAAVARIAEAELAWVVTVRPDGRPHATPMVPVVHDGKVYFHTGRTEVKYANLRANPHVLVLAGDTAWDRGLDVAFEGTAAEVTDDALLYRIAELYRRRWDGRWQLEGAASTVVATNPDVPVVVLAVTPNRARGHAKGDPFGQTTYRFSNADTHAQKGPS